MNFGPIALYVGFYELVGHTGVSPWHTFPVSIVGRMLHRKIYSFANWLCIYASRVELLLGTRNYYIGSASIS